MSDATVGLTHCPNCGRHLDGKYCAACGQKVTALDPTFHDFLHDLTHEVLHVDGKIFRSVRLLLTRPGFLSREHFAGRRARYVTPIRLYLIFSVIFFALSAAVSKPLSAEDRAELEQVQGPMQRLADVDMAARLEAWVPRMMFLLVPVFAAATARVTRRAGRNYPQHLYFALHVHAAVFAISTIFVLMRLGHNELMDAIADSVVLGCVAWYVVAAFHTAYGGTWRLAIGRAAIVGLLYGIGLGLATAAVIGILLLV